MVTYQRPLRRFQLGHHDTPSGPLEVFHTMDYDGFQSLNDQLCRNNRCDGDKELGATDAANPSSIADQNTMFSIFTSNARDTTAHSLSRNAHSVKAELARMIYRVDGDDNDTDTDG